MPSSYALPPRRVLPVSPPLESDETIDEEEDDVGSGKAAFTGGIQARIAALNLNHVGLNPSSRPTKRQSSLFSSTPFSPVPPAPSSPTSSLFSTSTGSTSASTSTSASVISQTSESSEQYSLYTKPPAEAPPRDEPKRQSLLPKKPPVPVPPPLDRSKTMHVTAVTSPSSHLRTSSYRLSLTQLPPILFRTSPEPALVPSTPTSALTSPSWRPIRAPPVVPSSPSPPLAPPTPPLPPSPSLPVALPRVSSPQVQSTFIPGVSCIKCHDFSHVDQHAKKFYQDSLSHSDELVQALVEPFDSETEKARALFAWFYHTVADEVKEIGNPEVGDMEDDPERMKQVFMDICVRFAELFVDLAHRAGLDAHSVWGYSKTHALAPLYHDDDEEEEHVIPPYENNDAWTCVMMDGEWHLIVPTWGRGFVSETEESIPNFASRWFTSTTPLEFRRTHFPDDSTYQLVSEDDGGSISWETFITAEKYANINTEFYEHDLNPATLQPCEGKLEGGQFYTFSVSKNCEHLSMAYEDNYCFVVFSESLGGAGAAVPLMHDEDNDGWSAVVRVPPASPGCTIHLGAVVMLSGQDAKGLKPERFARQEKIRKSADIRELVQWCIV